MSGNSIGQNFVVTTFGESHGVALGCIIDGCPPGLELTEADMQHDLDRRRPGTSRYTTARREPMKCGFYPASSKVKPRAPRLDS